MTPKLEKITVEVVVGRPTEPKRVSIPGYASKAFPGLVVHRPVSRHEDGKPITFSGGFVITHQRSGLRVLGPFAHRTDAVEGAAMLATGFNWAITREGIMRRKRRARELVTAVKDRFINQNIGGV